ncbi:MAG: Nramp family divalent metal transporter [Planctomycetes bacterium]|nr:Nramp family divalent metal transporter [Planctomycetota bacterium]
MLVAATGVGAGDLVTASLAGSELGTSLLWAALLGGALKFALNEGLARWQLASGRTLLAGWTEHLGAPVRLAFLAYLVLWSFVVGGALVSACGVAGQALLPFDDAHLGRIAWGVAHALVGLALVRRGGLRSFERVMAACIALMTLTVFATALATRPDPGELVAGLVPHVPAGGAGWTLGVLGGVGGTVTLLGYGYWIAEHGRDDLLALRTCRVDLAVGYALTALFGAAMIVIGARLHLGGSGAGVALALADELSAVLGAPGRWIFLLGFWSAVASSLLGVLQVVPYLFADTLRGAGAPRSRRIDASGDALAREPCARDLSRTRVYRVSQVLLALAPLPLLLGTVRQVALVYAVAGALFMPFLAGTLLVMTNRPAWIGERGRSGRLANGALLLTLLLFLWQAAAELLARLG